MYRHLLTVLLFAAIIGVSVQDCSRPDCGENLTRMVSYIPGIVDIVCPGQPAAVIVECVDPENFKRHLCHCKKGFVRKSLKVCVLKEDC